MTTKLNPKLEAFLDALPLASEDQFVNAPGIGTFRANHVRRGMERGVLVIHSTGDGLAIAQPEAHGACADCKGRKGSQPCEHCSCAMCSFFRTSDERASPRVSAEKLRQLARRMQTFQIGRSPQLAAVLGLDDDVV